MNSASAPDRSAARQRVRRVIERLIRDGTAVAADGRVHTVFPVAVSPAEGEALREWVAREGARETIEIGLGYGMSALFIGEALVATDDASAARHVAIDPHQATRFGDCGLKVLADAGLSDLVEFRALESQFALPQFLSQGRRFDLAFVDGNHRFDRVFLDLVYLGRLLRPGRIVFLDDYPLPAVARAVRFFLTNLGWTLEATSAGDDLHHWAVVRTSRAPDARPFDYFVEF
jgi:predicted O-methyltransferase YrrM